MKRAAKKIPIVQDNTSEDECDDYQPQNEVSLRNEKVMTRKETNEMREILVESHGLHHSFGNDYPLCNIKYALTNIDRKSCIGKLTQLVVFVAIAERIESGILDFALKHITTHKYKIEYVVSTYEDVLRDLLFNLDMSNTRIDNKTLLKALMESNTLKAELLAFLSPEQLHPKRWEQVVLKQLMREEAAKIITTDAYQCGKCKESKCVVTLVHYSGDEPPKLYATCVVCNNKFAPSHVKI